MHSIRNIILYTLNAGTSIIIVIVVIIIVIIDNYMYTAFK
jgi:hypothetical protein